MLWITVNMKFWSRKAEIVFFLQKILFIYTIYLISSKNIFYSV